jgi:hypothetical protein
MFFCVEILAQFALHRIRVIVFFPFLIFISYPSMATKIIYIFSVFILVHPLITKIHYSPICSVLPITTDLYIVFNSQWAYLVAILLYILNYKKFLLILSLSGFKTACVPIVHKAIVKKLSMYHSCLYTNSTLTYLITQHNSSVYHPT